MHATRALLFDCVLLCTDASGSTDIGLTSHPDKQTKDSNCSKAWAEDSTVEGHRNKAWAAEDSTVEGHRSKT